MKLILREQELTASDSENCIQLLVWPKEIKVKISEFGMAVYKERKEVLIFMALRPLLL